MEDRNTPKEKATATVAWEHLIWWSTLLVTVMAGASVAVLAALDSGAKGMVAVAVFMLVVWLLTYVAMRLMQWR